MKTRGKIILVLAIAAVTIFFILPCAAAEKQQKDEPNIWLEEGPRGPRGPRELREPGEPRGPRRGPGRFELTDEEIGRIMKSLKENNPEKAKELEKLRSEDPNRFKFELGRHGGEEFDKIIKERIETWRQKVQAEFLEWLAKNYRQEANELGGLKEKDPDLYWKKFDLIREKYWRIFEEEKRNPELAEVLKEDLELRKRCDELTGKIKGTTDDKEKKDLTGQLEEVVGRRFDLIIRRKQIEYERLLKRVEELQKHLKESKAEIDEWRDEKFKNENVKSRVKELLGAGLFKWD